ncbi:MAG: alpha amylase family protein [Chloroherpetonaceae bacterium]|nr:family 10 glycosylhydrolase [Chthonomonadaceae bacterium]MDW8209405.1 alpha amylase family protein [Chloroherpetonaceae bacterium]
MLLVLIVLCLLVPMPASGQRAPDILRGLAATLEAQGRVMWIDGTANLFRTIRVNGQEVVTDFTTTREGVAEIVRKCRQARINTLVVDVKPLSGHVLYRSKIAPRLREWRGRPVPDFDVLAAFVEEGHRAGLKVHAAINVLSEGHKHFRIGPAYERPHWQSVVYTVNRGILAPGGARLAFRVTGEPADDTQPVLLTETRTLLGADVTTGMVGLESVESGDTAALIAAPGATFGQKAHLLIDADHRVQGIVDDALLGDDPLFAPEDGHILTATRQADREWIAQNLRPGAPVRFDLRFDRVRIADAPSEKVAVFVNVLHPEVRRYELDLIREIVTGYDIDGLVLDRCRHSNLYNDFSDLTRMHFERYIGRPVARWPQDIFAFAPGPGEPIIRGPLFKKWLEFRARNIRDFVADVARLVRSLKPDIALGTYVGSWYPRYYEVGVNWGSERTHLRYPWFSEDYPRTGYAEFFDWITTGCYHPIATREEARRAGLSERLTVEHAADLSNQAVANAAFVYAGLYVPDYANRPQDFVRALEAAARQSHGFMIFDLVYIEQYDWWGLLERAFPKEVPAPHDLRGLLPAVRSALDAVAP